jgi:hypothetical protein
MAAEWIGAMLARGADASAEIERMAARRVARIAWAEQAVSDFVAAQRRVAEAWSRIFDQLGEELDEDELEALPDPPEQAVADALWAEIVAVRDRDQWPRHLHWGDV